MNHNTAYNYSLLIFFTVLIVFLFVNCTSIALAAGKGKSSVRVGSVFKGNKYSESKYEAIAEQFQMGVLALQSGELRDAELYFQDVLQKDSRHLDALNNLAVTYIRRGKLEKGQDILNKVRQIDPENPTALINLGFVNLRNEKYTEAKSFFQLALDLDPSQESALINLAYLYQMEKDYETAEIYYKRLQLYHEENINALLSYANLMEKRSQYVEAIELYRQVLENEGVYNDFELKNKIQSRVRRLTRYIN